MSDISDNIEKIIEAEVEEYDNIAFDNMAIEHAINYDLRKNNWDEKYAGQVEDQFEEKNSYNNYEPTFWDTGRDTAKSFRCACATVAHSMLKAFITDSELMVIIISAPIEGLAYMFGLGYFLSFFTANTIISNSISFVNKLYDTTYEVFFNNDNVSKINNNE